MSFPVKFALIYFVIITVVGFLLCGIDKFAAKKQMRRVPEKWLFIISAIGGSIGMYSGMLTFRHKTQHWYFVWGIPAIIVFQAAIILLILRVF